MMNLSIAAVVQQLAFQFRDYAKDAGTACAMPECDALTMGVRCEKCAKRICSTHGYWRLEMPKLKPYCVYCVLANHPDSFSEDGPDREESL